MKNWRYTGFKIKTSFVKEWGEEYIKEKEYLCFCGKWDKFYPCLECHRHGYTKKEDLLPKKYNSSSKGIEKTGSSAENWIGTVEFLNRLDGYYATFGTGLSKT